MLLQLSWWSKKNVGSVWKGHFSFFCKFLMADVESVSGKARQITQNYLNQNLVIGSFLENGFEATLTSKTSVVSAWKELFFFFFFANISLKKLKPFVGKERQNIQSNLNQGLLKGSLLENSFEVILSSKTSVVIVWKEHFSVFCKFLSDEVETIFWESEAKCSKLFRSKFGHRKLLRKWFWSYLELKNECSERLKRAFFSFLQIFEWRNWNRFLGERDNVTKTFS